MTVTMSSEGDSAKSILSESNEKSGTDNTDSSQDSHDVKDAKVAKEVENKVEKKSEVEKPKDEPTKESENAEKKPPVEEVKAEDKDKSNNTEVVVEEKDKKENNDKNAKNEEKSEPSEKEDDDEDEDSEKDDDDKEVPLLDQPLEKSGKRERKNVQRFTEDAKEKEAKTDGKIEFETGNGTALGDIPRVDASISRFKNDDLKLLHRLLFKVVGKNPQIKKNIRKFNGFEFKKDSEEYTKKVAATQKFEMKQLKSICEMLDLQKSGSKDEIIERVVDFLLAPKDSGKPVGGGRPKRTAAVRANNRGYSSHDDYSSDEKQVSRARRDKGRRVNLKDESSSESDEDFQPSDDGSEELPRVNKRKRAGRKKATSDEDDVSEVSNGSSDDSDDEPKNKRRKSIKTNNKTKAKSTPSRRGRKAATPAKKTPSRSAKKAKNESSEEEEDSDHKDEEGSSSEDEPLVKKTKTAQPPTDDEIKAYVKKILEGANLEEITMKTVCQRVYAHYPDFDLAHKKDFIKTTVKSLIST